MPEPAARAVRASTVRFTVELPTAVADDVDATREHLRATQGLKLSRSGYFEWLQRNHAPTAARKPPKRA